MRTGSFFLFDFSERGGKAKAIGKAAHDRPFACPQCPRRYNRKDNLQSHLRYECGKDPQFSCPVCAHKFAQRRYIPKHMMRRHPSQYEEYKISASSKRILVNR